MEQLETLKQEFYAHICDLQDRITARLRQLDPACRLIEDPWQRQDHRGDDGGGGRTRAFRGEIFENAGVNISRVFGALKPEFSTRLGGSADDRLWAAGISLIIHPTNPHAPSAHANFRLIQLGGRHWFGGGADLTPYYPHFEDFRQFHRVWADACEPRNCYESMKAACDSYFVNHHRDGEMRGVGGIFFDHYSSGDDRADFDFVRQLSEAFMPAYFPLVERRHAEAWSAEDEEFQLHRRGRYVEFNLLHDRGTRFGLQSDGRIESILISLPGRCRWSYDYKPRSGTAQATMMRCYRPLNWLAEDAGIALGGD